MGGALRAVGLVLFGVFLVVLETNAFPGPWVWTPWQILFVVVAVVIIGLAIARRLRKS
jgi:hypothetical protein